MSNPALHLTSPLLQENIFAQNEKISGFGEYQGFDFNDFEGYQSAQKTHFIVQTLLLGAVCIAGIAATIVLTGSLWAAPILIVPIAILGVRAYLNQQACSNYFPPDLIDGLQPSDFGGKHVGECIQETGSALVLKNAIESKRYKLDLISQAEQSIFMSCYMGEESLDEALDLIQQRMEQKPDLKVFILGSDHFLTSENKRRFEHLLSQYPDRFFAVFNPEVYYSQHPSGGRPMLSTNHIKLMAIDQGAYAIIGGCALRPFWSDVSGEDNLNSLEQAGVDLLNPLEAKGFRDMDFAIKSQAKGSGMTAFLEGAKLMLRYAYMQSPEIATNLKNQFLQLMHLRRVQTHVASIDDNPSQVRTFDINLYSTGPDHVRNSYLENMIQLINQAQSKIVIAHMFVHPPQALMDALIAAAERGVKIQIITNSTDPQAPLAHYFFHPLARKNLKELFKHNRCNNIKLYEYNQANITYHKKVMIVDDKYTAFGSTNLGLKSLDELASDYEFNAIVRSWDFARMTQEVIQRDIELSREIPSNEILNPSWKALAAAHIQEHTIVHLL